MQSLVVSALGNVLGRRNVALESAEQIRVRMRGQERHSPFLAVGLHPVPRHRNQGNVAPVPVLASERKVGEAEVVVLQLDQAVGEGVAVDV